MRQILYLLFLYFSVIGLYAQEQDWDHTFETANRVIYDICFTNSGKVLGIADGNDIRFYSTENGDLLEEYNNGHRDRILTLDISADSILMVSGGRDSIIVLWDVSTRNKLATLDYHKGMVTSVKISRDRKYLVSGGTDGLVVIYSLTKREILHTLSGHVGVVTAVDISPDGKLVASSGADKKVNVYFSKDGSPAYLFEDHNGWIRDLSVSSDGLRLYSCDDKSRIISHSLDGSSLQTNEHRIRNGWLLSLDLHEDNETIVTGSMRGILQITHPRVNYSYSCDVPILGVKFRPGVKVFLEVAIATRGKGVLMVSTKQMKAQ